MKLKNKDEFIERLRAAGIEPREEPTDLPMYFTISGHTTDDVTEDAAPLSLGFEEGVIQHLKHKKMKSTIFSVVVFPTILDPEVAPSSDSVTYKKDGSVFVTIELDHQRWIEASRIEKVDLYAEALAAAICMIKEKRLFPPDRQMLLDAIEQARLSLRRRRAN